MPITIGNTPINNIQFREFSISQVYAGTYLLWTHSNPRLTITTSDINSFKLRYKYQGVFTETLIDKSNLQPFYEIPFGAEVWIEDIVPDMDNSTISITTDHWSSFKNDAEVHIQATVNIVFVTLTLKLDSYISKAKVTIDNTDFYYTTSTTIQIAKGAKVIIDAIEYYSDSYDISPYASWDHLNTDVTVSITGVIYPHDYEITILIDPGYFSSNDYGTGEDFYHIDYEFKFSSETSIEGSDIDLLALIRQGRVYTDVHVKNSLPIDYNAGFECTEYVGSGSLEVIDGPLNIKYTETGNETRPDLGVIRHYVTYEIQP